jgi:outer membrane receptor protein involved in Fe transport
VPQEVRTGTNSFAFGSFPGGCQTCFATEDYERLTPPTQREGAALNLHYDIAPKLHFTLDAKYIRNQVHDSDQSSISFGDFQLQPDNAYITPAIAALIDPANPPLIARVMSDFGNRSEDITRETMRVVAGLDGEFDARFANVTWSGNLNFGETENHFFDRHLEVTGNFAAAIDSVIDSVIDPATGQAACRVNVPSAQFAGYTPPDGMVGPAPACVPYNPFGQQNSPAAIGYSTTNLHEYQRLVQEVANLNANFDTSRFFNLPGGPVSVAVGAEYRFEHDADKQDPLVIAGLTEVSQTPNFAGGFSVYEGYLEVSAPIFKHRFLLDELTVDGAIRGSHYSSVGTTDAWKISAVYGPIPSFKFRGAYSEAIRAPNITEGFLPPTGTFFTIFDPCDAQNIAANVNRSANCAALGIPPGFVANANGSVPGTVSGNTALTPEQSKTYTGGFIFQPTFFRNFALTVDYYDITIKNEINQVSAQDILDNCVDATGGPSQQYCSLFTRDATGNVNFIQSTYINASALRTNGLETQLTYALWLDPMHRQISTSSTLEGKLSLT